MAVTRVACEAERDDLAAWLRSVGQPDAANTLTRDWEQFVTCYEFPPEHWAHLRTSNALESVFAGVPLRTDVTKQARKRESALYLVFKSCSA